MASANSHRNTWSCNPASPNTTVSSQGSDIGRRTAELIRVTGSFLSVGQGSRRSTGQAFLGQNNLRAPSGHRKESCAKGENIDDGRDEGPYEEEKQPQIFDIEEVIDVVKDGGDSLRAAWPQLESRAPDAGNNEHQDLRTRLLNAREEASGGHYFIPLPTVGKILTKERVTEELGQKLPNASNKELEHLVQQICSQPGLDGGSRVRIFATLILINSWTKIGSFIESGLSDKDLPLSERELRQAFEGTIATDKTQHDGDNGSQEAQDRFAAQQWELCTPYFSNSSLDKVPHYKLHQETILPFTTRGSVSSIHKLKEGFGEVRKVKIHPLHHGFSMKSTRETSFAIKTLQTSDKAEFVKELYALRSTPLGPHCIELLATFERGNELSFIFPWAESGDLRQFWKANQPPEQLDSVTTQWILKQCSGLTQALSTIHNPKASGGGALSRSESVFGRHGDIKPENILLFGHHEESNPYGTLKLADFGLTRFHQYSEGRHWEGRCTPTYRAPEYDLNIGVTNQKYDIWSLACVFLEFTTWTLTGSAGIDDKFTAARSMDGLQDRPDDCYFVVEQRETDGTLQARIKPSVIQWMAVLRQMPACTEPLRSVLDLIKNRMLLVDVEARINAADSVAILEEAVSQVRKDKHDWIPKHALLKKSADESQTETVNVLPASQIQHKSGIENARIEILDLASRGVSTLDKLKLQVEQHVGHQLDWFPFRPPNRCPAFAEARLIWEYGGKEVSIFLNRHQLERYRHHVHAPNPGILPTATSPPGSTALSGLTIRWHTLCGDIRKALRSWQRKGGAKWQPAAKTLPTSTTSTTSKESYFCVDRYWTSVKQTNMYTVPAINLLEDDYQLFMALRQSLTVARGPWWHRLKSWRTCTGVKLSKFTFLFDDCDLVNAFEQKANGKSQEICQGYEYSCVPGLDFDEHMQLMAETMQLMAETMLQGLQEPERGRNGRAVLDGIPKLQVPPGIHRKQFNSGWGFHTTQGFCLIKIMLWVAAILTPGIIFVPAWLSSINATDLQNAFVPVSFLGALVGVILAIVLISAA